MCTYRWTHQRQNELITEIKKRKMSFNFERKKLTLVCRHFLFQTMNEEKKKHRIFFCRVWFCDACQWQIFRLVDACICLHSIIMWLLCWNCHAIFPPQTATSKSSSNSNKHGLQLRHRKISAANSAISLEWATDSVCVLCVSFSVIARCRCWCDLVVDAWHKNRNSMENFVQLVRLDGRSRASREISTVCDSIDNGFCLNLWRKFLLFFFRFFLFTFHFDFILKSLWFEFAFTLTSFWLEFVFNFAPFWLHFDFTLTWNENNNKMNHFNLISSIFLFIFAQNCSTKIVKPKII